MSNRHQDTAEHQHSGRRPAEYYIDEKWDKCIDLTLRRVTYSSLAAGAVAIVLLSKLLMAACIAFAITLTLEQGYQECALSTSTPTQSFNLIAQGAVA